MIVCMTTKSLNEEAFSTLDHDVKINEKDMRADLLIRKELGSCEKKYRCHFILERIEKD